MTKTGTPTANTTIGANIRKAQFPTNPRRNEMPRPIP
jgi:hypothetical protein